MRILSVLKRTWKQPGLWITLVAILVAVTAANRASTRYYQWPHLEDQGETHAPSATAFLETAQQQAFIWRPSGMPLTYQPLGGVGIAVPIVHYPDVDPDQWKAIPAGPDTYHLIWLERDGRLRSALIDVSGQTLRGPVELATDARPDYVALPLPDGDSLALWIGTSRGQLTISRIDREGRPGPTYRPLSTPIERVAAALDQDSAIHLVWLVSSSPGSWAIRYQVTSAVDFSIDAPISLLTITLAPEESLTSLSIGLDRTHGYVFWSITATGQPDSEQVHVLAFPLNHPAHATASELHLPQRFKPTQNIQADDLVVGRVDGLTSALHPLAALRWPHPAAGQHSLLPVAFALRMPDGWHPGVIYYQDGLALGFQIAGQYPADAGPPTLSIDPSGGLHLAWSGLQGVLPHLYTAETGQQGLIAARPQTPNAASGALAGILVGMPLGLLWVVFPTCLVLLAPDNVWTLPLAFALYGLAKLVWPPDLFAQISPALAAAGLDRFDPGFAVALGTLGIAAISATLFRLVYPVKWPLWQRWLVYALLDASLTWGVFGANVFHW